MKQFVVLAGGLGNQLFQYAMGKSLARQYNRSLFLDIREFSKVVPTITTRSFELSELSIKDLNVIGSNHLFSFFSLIHWLLPVIRFLSYHLL
mgnify:CR=1 FL=1